MLAAAWLFLKAIDPRIWIALAVIAAILGFGQYRHHQGVMSERAKTEVVRKEYSQFVANVKAQGEAATKRAKETEAADKLRKDQADANHAKAVAALNARIAGLRKSNSNIRYLSNPAAPAGSSQTACLDAEAADRAISGFVSEISGIVESGDKAVTDLNTVREWANKSAP